MGLRFGLRFFAQNGLFLLSPEKQKVPKTLGFSGLCSELGNSSAVRGGFEPPVRLHVRQFSKLLVSATHPPHRAGCKYNNGLGSGKRFFTLDTQLVGDEYSSASFSGFDVREKFLLR